MNKFLVVGISSFVVLGFLVFSSVISLLNTETELRVKIEAVQKENTAIFDNTWKKIKQVAQVSEKQKEALKEIFTSYAEARTNINNAPVISWIKESVPNVDLSSFNNLQNIIVASRDDFVDSQRVLIDVKREHDLLLRKFPNSVIFPLFNRKPIDIVIVTSTTTEEVFKAGKEDNIEVF